MKELLVTLSAAVILGFVNTGGAAEANNFEKDRKAILDRAMKGHKEAGERLKSFRAG